MSIASQIEDYADGLSDAYAMVAQRGGTIPAQKNMNNLDTAIATIPSGGSTPTTPTITSATYNSNNGTIEITGTNFGDSPVVKVFNRAANEYQSVTATSSSSTSAVIPVGNSTFGYYSRVVKIENGGFETAAKFVYGDFENLGATGYDVIVWAYKSNSNKSPLGAFGGAIGNFCAPRGTQLSNSIQTPYSVGFACTPLDPQSTATYTTSPSVKGAEIKPGITNLAGGNGAFLSCSRNLTQPLGLADITKISTSGFLAGCASFNQPLDTRKITNFGVSFMCYCTSFNQPIDVSAATNIGKDFLRDCIVFDQPLAFEGTSSAPITITADGFMRDALCYSKPISFNYCNIPSGTNGYFMSNVFNLPSVTFRNLTIASGQTNGLIVNNQAINSPAYIDGVVINGDSASVNTILTQWPNLSSGTYYRKLVQGTIS